MRIIGIDPGYDRVGWAIGESNTNQIKTVLDFGCIQTSSKQTLIERYQAIETQLSALISQHQPSEMAIESLFFSNNQKTALHVSEARGVILSCGFRQGLNITEYTPLQIKQAVTGYGKADKEAVRKMVEMQFKVKIGKAIIDDTVDALALLITHAASATLKKTTNRV